MQERKVTVEETPNCFEIKINGVFYAAALTEGHAKWIVGQYERR